LDFYTAPWLELARVTEAHSVHGLHKGETQALQLALERRADAVLMDDMEARAAARLIGIPAIFTISILELAAERNLIDFPRVITNLRQTSFFISQQILDTALERDKRRRESKPD
jgi:predicted nucleic acid-binding protein